MKKVSCSHLTVKLHSTNGGLSIAMRLRRACDPKFSRRTRSAVADPFSNATALRMALRFNDRPYSFIAALSQQTELEVGRYRYLNSVSVFGIFFGIF
jgi:hypothetical protein